MTFAGYIRFQRCMYSQLFKAGNAYLIKIWKLSSEYKINFILAQLIFLFTACEKDIFVDKSNNPEYIFDSYWHEIDRNYAFFTHGRLDWDSVYEENRTLVNSGTSEKALFQVLSNVTDLLHDAHTNIYSPFGVAGNVNYFDRYPVNKIALADSYFEFHNNFNRIFDYGKLKTSNLGYIRIKTFEGDNTSLTKIDSLLTLLNSTNGLIIDVRSNKGGNISNAKAIASRFADSTRLACKYRIRNGPQHNDFSEWINVCISPLTDTEHYAKPVAVLTNRRSYSATEWFVMFAGVLPNITLVGDTTGGGSGIPLVRELPNGWLIRTSNTQTVTPAGHDFQFTGLYPDIPVWITPEDLKRNIDTILETAVSLLSGL